MTLLVSIFTTHVSIKYFSSTESTKYSVLKKVFYTSKALRKFCITDYTPDKQNKIV